MLFKSLAHLGVSTGLLNTPRIIMVRQRCILLSPAVALCLDLNFTLYMVLLAPYLRRSCADDLGTQLALRQA